MFIEVKKQQVKYLKNWLKNLKICRMNLSKITFPEQHQVHLELELVPLDY